MLTWILPLALLAGSPDEAPALPASLSLSEERPRQEEDPQRPQERPESTTGVMEYITRNGMLELGMLYTDFDGDLRLETDLGFYARLHVAFQHGVSAHLAYRHYEFSSSVNPGKVEESISLRGVLGGASYHHPLTKEIALVGTVGAGIMRWESNLHEAGDDVGFLFSVEGGATMRLWTVLRAKLSVLLDAAKTDFHQDSSDWNVSVSGILGFELGL
jgi:hypothetical protein